MTEGKRMLALLGVSVALHAGILHLVGGWNDAAEGPWESPLEVDFLVPERATAETRPAEAIPQPVEAISQPAEPARQPVRIPKTPTDIPHPALDTEEAAADPFSNEPPEASFMPQAPGLPPSTAQNSDPTILMKYKDVLSAWLDRYKFYPRSAERGGIEGETLLRIAVAQSGRVLSAVVETSSGSLVLDRAALNMVEQAAPFPAFPAYVRESSLQYLIPVAFTLQ